MNVVCQTTDWESAKVEKQVSIFALGLKLRMRLDPEKDFATFFHVKAKKCCFDNKAAQV